MKMRTVLFALTALCAGVLRAAGAGALGFTVVPSGRYLAVPVANGTAKTRLEVFDGGERIAYFNVEWAGGTTNWTGSLDLGDRRGRPLTFRFSGGRVPSVSAADLVFSDRRFPAPDGQFEEPWRPRIHFTPPLGWNNDPNGLSWYGGEWHLFYQSNPFGIAWDNMSWGHAVSKDLVNWRDVGYALAPDDAGVVFSGSAVVDAENTAGFGKGAHILFYSASGKRRDQRLAWSRDGRAYTRLPDPIVPVRRDADRDPKVFWYAPGRHWVMVIYGEVEKKRHGVSIFTSKNLVDWSFASRVGGDFKEDGYYLYECPDLFELTTEDGKDRRWVLTAGNQMYAIGSFDGRVFRPEAERLDQNSFINGEQPVYAWQTFSGVPDGRCVQIAWSRFETLKSGHEGAMFSQGMSLPMELTLVRTPEGLRMARFPVRELRSLREGAATSFRAFDGELAEAEFFCKPAGGGRVTFDFRGIRIVYDAGRRTLSVGEHATAWKLDGDGRFGLRVFVDRVGLEIFSLDGLQYLPLPRVRPDPAKRTLSWRADGAAEPVSDVIERVWRLRRAEIVFER